MSLNSINTNIAAYYAQQNINKAAQSASLSVSRLSSGNRIVNASDDVAALAAGTALKSQVTTLRTALQNASQGGSLLQVADGALSQIQDILQRQKAIAVQASSGSVDDTQRSFLNQEFQALTSEIDRLSGSTNFNGVNLLDGSVFSSNTATTNAGASAAGSVRLFLSSTNFVASDAIAFKLGGNAVTFSFTATATTSVQATLGAGASTSIDSLIAKIDAYTGSNSSVLTGYTFTRVGNSLEVAANNSGTLASQNGGLVIDTSGVTNDVLTTDGTTLATHVYALANATDAGLGDGSTSVTGTVGDSVLSTLDNSKANVTIAFDGNLSSFISGGIPANGLTIAGVAFSFTSVAATSTAKLIQVGTSFNDTINNIVQTLNAFTSNTVDGTNVTAANKYAFNQLTFRRDGNNVIVEGKEAGSVFTSAQSSAATVVSTVTNSSPLSAASLSGTTTGVNVDGVNNAAFVGTISGFTASYVSSNTANLSVKVGDSTYTASAVNTNSSSATNVKFTSSDGGSFTIDLAASQGTALTDQSDADTYAARLNAGFSTLSFQQDRAVNSYTPVGNIVTSSGTNIGTLNGTSFDFHLGDYSSLQVSDLSVNAPITGATTGSISMTVNGETFNSGAISTTIGANAVIRLASTSNANHYINFNGPSTASNVPGAVTSIDISSLDNANTVEAALKHDLGFDKGGQSLTFQVGNKTTDVLSVSIGTATASALFAGATVDVTSQNNASTASAAVDAAINSVTSIRSGVGALQERFNFASAAISSSIQNQDAARGTLLDTDVATESTAYAQSQVQLQAGIAVLAQANLLPQNLLKLIG